MQDGFNPIHFAAGRGHTPVLPTLLGDPRARPGDGDKVRRAKKVILRTQGGSWGASTVVGGRWYGILWSRMLHRCETDSVPRALWPDLIACGSYRWDSGVPLHRPAPPVFQLLPGPSDPSQWGSTPLHYAAWEGHTAACKHSLETPVYTPGRRMRCGVVRGHGWGGR